jgi:hypothetical protein
MLTGKGKKNNCCKKLKIKLYFRFIVSLLVTNKKNTTNRLQKLISFFSFVIPTKKSVPITKTSH